ncbi:hypothetical protein AVEN_111742-1 [Araneus ventricosus]|uniref:Uncharacterized protein n=1 Tax=Araneus ventricosus TaxID=182803 RepID=A0A4Y2SJS4_ARAVE|nr:hypothetical protein AVEN_111742-1 [Araneus ventricosus]
MENFRYLCSVDSVMCIDFRMPRKFLTAQEGLDLLWTSDGSGLEDIDNELVIVPSDADALSDTGDIDDSSTIKIEETMCDDQCFTNVHYML